jgi:hypothetical protein
MHDTEHVAFQDDQTVASAHAGIAAQGTRGLPARLGNRPRASARSQLTTTCGLR